MILKLHVAKIELVKDHVSGSVILSRNALCIDAYCCLTTGEIESIFVD